MTRRAKILFLDIFTPSSCFKESGADRVEFCGVITTPLPQNSAPYPRSILKVYELMIEIPSFWAAFFGELLHTGGDLLPHHPQMVVPLKLVVRTR